MPNILPELSRRPQVAFNSGKRPSQNGCTTRSFVQRCRRQSSHDGEAHLWLGWRLLERDSPSRMPILGALFDSPRLISSPSMRIFLSAPSQSGRRRRKSDESDFLRAGRVAIFEFFLAIVATRTVSPHAASQLVGRDAQSRWDRCFHAFRYPCECHERPPLSPPPPPSHPVYPCGRCPGT